MTRFQLICSCTLKIPTDQLDMFRFAWNGKICANRNEQWAGQDDIYGDFYNICKSIFYNWFEHLEPAKANEAWACLSDYDGNEFSENGFVIYALRDALEQVYGEECHTQIEELLSECM